MPEFEDFERYVAERGISDEERPEAFAGWLAEQIGGPPVGYENVQPGDEQVLPDPEQRELDGLPSALDRKNDE